MAWIGELHVEATARPNGAARDSGTYRANSVTKESCPVSVDRGENYGFCATEIWVSMCVCTGGDMV
jgi:hypothetical protein